METIAPDVKICPLCGGELRDCPGGHTDSDRFPGPRRHCANASLHNFLVEVPAS